MKARYFLGTTKSASYNELELDCRFCANYWSCQNNMYMHVGKGDLSALENKSVPCFDEVVNAIKYDGSTDDCVKTRLSKSDGNPVVRMRFVIDEHNMNTMQALQKIDDVLKALGGMKKRLAGEGR